MRLTSAHGRGNNAMPASSDWSSQLAAARNTRHSTAVFSQQSAAAHNRAKRAWKNRRYFGSWIIFIPRTSSRLSHTSATYIANRTTTFVCPADTGTIEPENRRARRFRCRAWFGVYDDALVQITD